MVDVAEGVAPGDRLHKLMLVMTGRVDDDAVNAAREMLGTGQLDTAAEFLAGCLLAGRIPVTSSEQYHLRRVLDEVRSDHGLADRLHVVESVPVEEHRFSEQYESDRDLVEALDQAANRLDGVRALWCTWRTTPAGVTYGAVPRRVLLAEVGPEGSITAVGYQLIEALRRAGIGCSVDVFSSGSELPDYHRDALSAAHRVHLDMPMVAAEPGSSSRARAPRMSSGGEAAGGSDLPSEPAAPPPEPELEHEPESFSTELVEPVEEDFPEIASEPEVAAPAVTERPTESRVSASRAAESRTDESNMRVPAAVDAKLTDRERNLLRKLHEELAQREQDRGDDQQPVSSRGGQREAWSNSAGTGGFPPINATSAQQQTYGQQ